MTSRTAFAIPAFRRLWGAGLISDTGDWLLFIALPLVVFQLTGSALGTSIAFLLELIPPIVLSPVAAMLVGRFDRRWLMVVLNVGQALALLPLLWVHDSSDLAIAYVVIVVHASLSTIFEPAKNTLLPELVDTDRLVSANALVGLNQNLGRLIGGPLGGVLLAVGDLGLIVMVDAVTYLVSAALIATLPAVRGADPAAGPSQGAPAGSSHGAPAGSSEGASAGSPHGASAGSPHGAPAGVTQGAPAGSSHGAPASVTQGAHAGSSHGAPAGSSEGACAAESREVPAGSSHGAPAGVTQGAHAGSSHGAPAEDSPAAPAPFGLGAALGIRRLRGAYAVILVSSVAQGMFLVLFVLFALGPLRGSDADVGLLRGIQAIGAIAAGLVLGFLARGRSPRLLTAASLFAFGAISLVTWNLPPVTTAIWPYIVLFTLVGAPGVIMVAGLMSALQEHSEPRQRGAVFAAVGLFSALGQAGGILLGALADGPVGLLPLLEIQGALYLLSGVIALLWLPRDLVRPATVEADQDAARAQ